MAGCGRIDEGTGIPPPQAGSTAAAGKTVPRSKGVIGLSVLTLINPFFKVIADTMVAEAAPHGYEVFAVSGDFDVDKQANQVKDFIVKQAIKEGKIYADPIQFPGEIGRKTVQAILQHFAGEEVPAQILIPTQLYRRADAEKDPELK
ncbi:MAG: hypothetical protein HY717_06770 [Planctomycetes bacterium]|nr:hypothetical protein [Planctomycetota bacterium]